MGTAADFLKCLGEGGMLVIANPLVAPVAEPCSHRIADARNPVVKSGYVCVDCLALFAAADHLPVAAQPAAPCPHTTGCRAGDTPEGSYHWCPNCGALEGPRGWCLPAASGVDALWVELTDEDRKAVFDSLDGGLEGFLKTWGWLHFAKGIEAKCREKNEVLSTALTGAAKEE
jgi:hypothetical protein